jgi:hypothetical protein
MKPKKRGKLRNLVWATRKIWTEIALIRVTEYYSQIWKMLERSRYSYWLRAGRPRSRSSSPARVKSFLFSRPFRPTLRSTQPPVQWVPGDLSPGVKRTGCEGDHSPLTSAEVPHMPSWCSA